jgi:magnesium transporter
VSITIPTETEKSHAHPIIVSINNGEVRDLPFEEVDREIARENCLVWIDLEGPTRDEMDRLKEELSLHPLAVEDIRAPHQRPKVDDYEGSCLVVLFAATLAEHVPLALTQVAIFMGPGYLVTVHDLPLPALEDMRNRLRADPKLIASNPLGFLLYRICLALVEGYFPIVDMFDDRIERLEDRLFRRLRPVILKDTLKVRRELVELRRAITPQRDVFTTLARHEEFATGPVAAYFTDLVDYSLRVTDTIDTLRDRLGTALDSYLTLQSNALNETMKRLTGVTILLTLPMIISGIYGMNFDSIPELHWGYGYAWALGLIVVTMVIAAWVLRHNDWL